MVPNHQPAHDILCLKNPQWHTTIPYQTLWHHEHPQWIWNGNSKKGCDKIWYNYRTYKQNVSKKNHLHPFMIHVSSNCSYIPSQMFPPKKTKTSQAVVDQGTLRAFLSRLHSRLVSSWSRARSTKDKVADAKWERSWHWAGTKFENWPKTTDGHQQP